MVYTPLKVGDRVYHKRADIFGKVTMREVDPNGTYCMVKYEAPWAQDAPAQKVLEDDLVLASEVEK